MREVLPAVKPGVGEKGVVIVRRVFGEAGPAREGGEDQGGKEIDRGREEEPP